MLGLAWLHAISIKPALKNRDELVFSFWMLPMPATYVLDQRGIIRRACVGPDSITGATTETVLAALSELDGPKPRP